MGSKMSTKALRTLRNLLTWEAEFISKHPKLEGNKQLKETFEGIYNEHINLGKKLAAKGMTASLESLRGDARMEELSTIIANRYAPIINERQLR